MENAFCKKRSSKALSKPSVFPPNNDAAATWNPAGVRHPDRGLQSRQRARAQVQNTSSQPSSCESV